MQRGTVHQWQIQGPCPQKVADERSPGVVLLNLCLSSSMNVLYTDMGISRKVLTTKIIAQNARDSVICGCASKSVLQHPHYTNYKQTITDQLTNEE